MPKNTGCRMKKSMVKKIFVFVVAICFYGEVIGDPSIDIDSNIQLCAACHGAKGITANPQWPNLAGQHSSYLRKQLNDYKVGKTRNAVIMTGVVAGLSEKEIDLLAQYYAVLPSGKGKTPVKYQKLGEALYRSGDFDKGITACIACHGPKGSGNDEAGFPAVSGQPALYTIQQLQAFKDKTRSNDLNGIMHDISQRMNQEESEAVAYFIQGLH